jgi:antitoxin component YwqK of YwqJK toxin-antitoxin module
VNGAIKEEGENKDGKSHNTQKKYLSDGTLSTMLQYDEGKCILETRYFKSGEKNQEITFSNRTKVKKFTSYTKSGKVYFTSTDMNNGHVTFLHPETEECIAHAIDWYSRIDYNRKCSDVK